MPIWRTGDEFGRAQILYAAKGLVMPKGFANTPIDDPEADVATQTKQILAKIDKLLAEPDWKVEVLMMAAK